jgi:branched-chain amino acid transport system substrate-binding protein
METAMHKPAFIVALCGFATLIAFATQLHSEKQYGPGVSDTEIKLGQTMPYSGPLSAYGAVGKAQLAYIAKVNAEGGINGRKLTLISLDDGYNPARTVEGVRQLVEQEQVLLIFGSVGTVPNMAVRKYLNTRHVPHLFIAGGDRGWSDYAHFPWTIGWMPPYKEEAKLYAQDILQKWPGARVGLLYANDDYGRDYAQGFKEGLGTKAGTMIVGEQTFEWTDPTIDTQIYALKASGADTIFSAMGGKHASQAIRKMAEIGWRPRHYTGVPSASVKAILEPAGLDNAVGLVSAWYAKYIDPQKFRNDVAGKTYFEWAQKYYDGDPEDGNAIFGYELAQALEYVLRRCGDDLTRENVMHVATNLDNVSLPLFLPGVRVSTSPTDYHPIKQLQLMRFNGKNWEFLGSLLNF